MEQEITKEQLQRKLDSITLAPYKFVFFIHEPFRQNHVSLNFIVKEPTVNYYGNKKQIAQQIYDVALRFECVPSIYDIIKASYTKHKDVPIFRNLIRKITKVGVAVQELKTQQGK